MPAAATRPGRHVTNSYPVPFVTGGCPPWMGPSQTQSVSRFHRAFLDKSTSPVPLVWGVGQLLWWINNHVVKQRVPTHRPTSFRLACRSAPFTPRRVRSRLESVQPNRSASLSVPSVPTQFGATDPRSQICGRCQTRRSYRREADISRAPLGQATCPVSRSGWVTNLVGPIYREKNCDPTLRLSP